MQISTKTWNEYITRLSRLNQKAGQLMREYIDAHGTADTDDLVAYAYGLVTKYGEGSTELACQMYEALAEAQGVYVPAAEPAETASYSEVARMVNATKDQNPANLANGVSPSGQACRRGHHPEKRHSRRRGMGMGAPW